MENNETLDSNGEGSDISIVHVESVSSEEHSDDNNDQNVQSNEDANESQNNDQSTLEKEQSIERDTESNGVEHLSDVSEVKGESKEGSNLKEKTNSLEEKNNPQSNVPS